MHFSPYHIASSFLDTNNFLSTIFSNILSYVIPLRQEVSYGIYTSYMAKKIHVFRSLKFVLLNVSLIELNYANASYGQTLISLIVNLQISRIFLFDMTNLMLHMAYIRSGLFGLTINSSLDPNILIYLNTYKNEHDAL
jgi:hypothetical protein